MTNPHQVAASTALAALLLTSAGADQPQKNKEYLDARERTKQVEDVFSSEAFHWLATVKLYDLLSGPVEGTIERTQFDKESWRDEIKFSGFNETIVVLGDKRYRQMNQDFEPLAISRARRMTRFFLAKELQKPQIKQITEIPIGGVPAKCFVQAPDPQIRFVSCFDEKMGTVLREQENLVNTERIYDYSDFVTIGQHSYPRNFKLYHNGDLSAQMQLTEIGPAGGRKDDILVPPANSVVQNCKKFDRAVVTPVVKTNYTYDNWPTDKPYGVAAVGVRLTDRGDIEKEQILESAGKSHDEWLLRMIRKWQFEPARCDGQKVKSTFYVEMPFPPQFQPPIFYFERE